MAKIKRYETKTNNTWYETEITNTQLTELRQWEAGEIDEPKWLLTLDIYHYSDENMQPDLDLAYIRLNNGLSYTITE